MVIVTVNATNDKPVANDDAAATNEDVAVAINVLANDNDNLDLLGNIDPTSVAITNNSSNGTTSVNGITGVVTYTPNADFNGIDTFSYQVCDDGFPLPIACDTAMVIVTVNPTNDKPVANDDAAATNEDVAVAINVLANDNDNLDLLGNIDPTSVAITSNPSNGTTSVNGITGVVTYTPNANFNGIDTFSYQVCDDGFPLPAVCDTAMVIVTVNATNDKPVANDDAAATNEDVAVAINVLANDNDNLDLLGNIDPTSVAITNNSSNGTTSVNGITGVVTYTPNADFNGIDTFSYQVCDDGFPLPAVCDTAMVIVTVNATNDKPVANDDVASTTENNPVTTAVILNDNDGTDPLGNIDPTTVTIVTAPINGTTSVNPITGGITYTPNPNFNGIDTYTYEVCDDGNPLPALCDTATVTVTIISVNNPPIANNDTDTTNEDTPVITDVLANDNDANDALGSIDSTSVTIIANPVNGIVSVNPITGEITYTPNPNFNGTDIYVYEVCDNGNPLPALCDQAVVSITVNAVNDAPTANDDVASTNEDMSVTVNVTLNDLDFGQNNLI
jgi:hypothetical protein